MALIIGKLRVIVIVRPSRVRLKMPMDSRMGMVSIGFVHVLRCHHRRKSDAWGQNQTHDDARRSKRHCVLIITSVETGVKPGVQN